MQCRIERWRKPLYNSWLVVSTPLKNISQLGDYSQYMEKNRMFQTTNQLYNSLLLLHFFCAVFIALVSADAWYVDSTFAILPRKEAHEDHIIVNFAWKRIGRTVGE